MPPSKDLIRFNKDLTLEISIFQENYTAYKERIGNISLKISEIKNW